MLRNMRKKLSPFSKKSVSIIKICEYETTLKLRSMPFHVNIERFTAEFEMIYLKCAIKNEIG
jgi:hypothetical protein